MQTPGKSMTAEDLRRNMMSTYFTLRVGIVLLSMLLPLALLVYSLAVHGRLVESSVSAFYSADGGAMRTFAILFFACMVAVCLFCARDTLTLLPDKSDQDKFKRAYLTIAVLLFVSPLVALGTAYFAEADSSRVFFIEWFGVYVFAAYWATKTVEFKISSAERRALYGAIKNVEGVGLVPEEPSGEQLRRLSGPTRK